MNNINKNDETKEQEAGKNKISDILEKIHKNELTLKPKTYFRLKYAALIVVGVAIFFVSMFLSSFIVFSFRASGHESLIGFGLSGWELFVILFPWNLLLVEIVLIILLEWFLRSFRFGYKVPVLYLLLAVLALMLVTGFVVDQTHLHDDLLHEADQHQLPEPFDDFYENVRRPPPSAYGVFKGTITEIQGGVLTVALDNPEGLGTTTPIFVVLPEDASSSPENATDSMDAIKPGDRIFIFGDVVAGQIHARGIRIAHDMQPPTDGQIGQ